MLDDRSLATALVAIQGPRAVEIVTPLTDVDLGALKYYAIAEGTVAGIPALVARTGYTGEDGFEVFVETSRAAELWDALIAAGQPHGLLPIGLGARDTLRLEAGMPLYGNELDRETNPFEAGLGRVVKLDKPGDFVGRAALEKVATDGPAKRLVGLVMQGRGIARHGYPVHAGDRRTGVVTSGTQSPTLGKAIAMAYVAPGRCRNGYDPRRRDPRSAGGRRGRRPAVLPPTGLTPLPGTTGNQDELARRTGAPPSEDRGDAPLATVRGGSAAMVPADLRYTKDHEWVRVDGDEAIVGITDYAANQLGDIVFVELPDVGRTLSQFATFGVVESVKAVSDLFAPVSGEVTSGNDALAGDAGAREQRPVRRGLDDPA